MARGRVFQREPGRGRPWSYVVDAEIGPDGRRLQRKRGGFRTRAEAEAALRAYLSDRDAGRPSVGRSGRTLAEWLQEWLETKASSVKPTTLESYRYAVRALITPRLGGLRLHDVRPVHLQRLYTTLRNEGSVTGGSLRPRSARLAHQVQSRRWRWLRRRSALHQCRPAWVRKALILIAWPLPATA